MSQSSPYNERWHVFEENVLPRGGLFLKAKIRTIQTDEENEVCE